MVSVSSRGSQITGYLVIPGVERPQLFTLEEAACERKAIQVAESVNLTSS